MDTGIILLAGRWGICMVALAVTTFGLLYMGAGDQEWSLQLGIHGRGVVFLLCQGNAMCVMYAGGQSVWRLFLLGVLGGCFLAASVMDWWEQMVYRFVWLSGAAAGSILLIGADIGLEMWYPLMLFWALQEILFVRFYGRADCHAFCVSALALTALGGGFADYVLHMFVAFFCLTVVQLIKRNIGPKGKLKKAVPLLPYITVAFWLWVDFGIGKWYI